MRLLAGFLAAAALTLAGCGSGSSDHAATKPRSATGPKTATIPEVQGGSSKKGGTSTESKTPPPAANGEVIKAGNFLAFRTPSGKLGCAYTKDPTTLRCDTAYPTRFSRSGHHCTEGDYGHSFQMSPGGRSGAICAGDTVLSATNARTIPYGHTWTIGPYGCTSQTSSLTCTNGQGHGWRLSLQEQRLF
jgi:hypothetical protein